MEKLKLLIFSYYREDPQINKLLRPLHSCRFFRSWDSIYIECLDSHHLNAVSELLTFLAPPFALLGLAKKIVLRGPRYIKLNYAIQLSTNSDLFNSN